jgi:uncharacterized protein (TIRG00374 family)
VSPPREPGPAGRLLTPALRLRRRIFASSSRQPAARRGTDVLLLVLGAVALALLTIAYPPSAAERALVAFFDSLPDWLDPVWRLLFDAMFVWVVILLVAALVGRRVTVIVHALVSLLVATGLAVVLFRLAAGDWPDGGYISEVQVDAETFPVLRVAIAGALVLAMVPHLIRPLRATSRWLLLAGVVGAMLGQGASPTGAIAAVLTAGVAATTVRLLFGTSGGYPERDDVIAAMAEMGVAVSALEPATRQPAGVFLARGHDADGRPLLAKVYGRDAYDTQLVEKAWRTLWYRHGRPRVRLTRLQAVEHEALMTLLARQAGVPTREVVIAGESSTGDAVIVFRDDSVPLAEVPGDAVDPALLASGWDALAALEEAGIAHVRLDPTTVVRIGDRLGFVDLDASGVAGRLDRGPTDRAQLLASTAAVAGAEPAVAAAARALGPDGLEQVLPYLQSAAFGPVLRQALKGAGIEVDDLRAHAADAAGIEAPALIKFRRVTWWTLAQLALLAFAISSIVGALAGVDYEQMAEAVREAEWGWLVAAFVLAQTPRLTQSVSTLGSVAARLPFMPVYMMQLATGYMNLALPSNLARAAINIRFFQRQGIAPVTAVTAGVIDSTVSTVIQALLLAVILIFTGSNLDLGLDSPSGPSTTTLLIVAGVAVGAVLVAFAVGRFRRTIAERWRRWWPEAKEAIRSLGASNRLAMLIGGSLATEVLFATTLGVVAAAFGYEVGLLNLLLINISVSLLASFIPVPGGIGVTEFGLTVGLTAAGVPEETALAIALLYRLFTFYIPPIWGFFAFRWLGKNSLL